jgi:tetratricopeptide (TPR) repeat protein
MVAITLLVILLVASLPACTLPGSEPPIGKCAEGARLEEAARLVRANRHDEAYALYKRIVSTCPDSPEALLHLGVLEFMKSNYSGAAHYFSESLRHDPMNADTWQRLGRTRLKLHRFKEAAQAFRQSFEIEPDMSVKLKEGSAELEAGDTDKARIIFESMILEDPLQHGALYFLGNIHRAEGYTDKAARFYEAVIKLHPSTVEAYVNLASIRYAEGRYDEAASLLEKTLVEVPLSAPYDPMVRLNLGLCYLHLKDDEKAKGHFQGFLNLSPEGENAEKVKAILKNLEISKDEMR